MCGKFVCNILFLADIRMLTLWGHRSKQAHVTHEIKYVQVARMLLSFLGTNGLSPVSKCECVRSKHTFGRVLHSQRVLKMEDFHFLSSKQ